MEIKKILETVFIKEHNTIAQILEDDIVVCLWNNVYQNRKECFEYMNEYTQGLPQSSLCTRFLQKRDKNRKGGYDPLAIYDKLFDDLEKYSEKKFKEFKKPNHLNSFDFKWYTTEEEEGKSFGSKYKSK